MGHPALQEHQQARAKRPPEQRQTVQTVWGLGGCGRRAMRATHAPTHPRQGGARSREWSGRANHGKEARACGAQGNKPRTWCPLPTDVCASRVLDRCTRWLTAAPSGRAQVHQHKWGRGGRRQVLHRSCRRPHATDAARRAHTPPRPHASQSRPARGGGPR